MCVRQRKNSAGFSLIELSIALVIGGLLLVGFLRIYALERNSARLATTKERLLELRTAINVYAATYGRLPCPASPSGKPADSDTPCVDNLPPPDVIVFTPEDAKEEDGMTIWTGAVPAAELGIPEVETTDGWHNKFTYAVTLKLTQPDALMKSPPPPGSIGIANEHGENVLDDDGAGRFIVFSHGRSAKGAWTSESVHIPCDKRARDGANCDGDNMFVSAGQSLGRGEGFYDDFLTHDQLDTGGNLAGKLAVCHARLRFYAPQDGKADTDGCVNFVENAWQGLCLHLYDGGEDGVPKSGKRSVATLAPSFVANAAGGPALGDGDLGDCGCPKGYISKEVGAWLDVRDGTDPADSNCGLKGVNPDGSMENANAPALQVLKNGQWVPCINRPGKPPTTRTALYTCIQQ